MNITWRKATLTQGTGVIYALDLDNDPTGLVLTNLMFGSHPNPNPNPNHKWKIVNSTPWEIQEVPDHLQEADIELIKEYAIAIWRLES